MKVSRFVELSLSSLGAVVGGASAAGDGDMDELFDALIDAREDHLDALYALKSNPHNADLIAREGALQKRATAAWKALAPYLSQGQGKQQAA